MRVTMMPEKKDTGPRSISRLMVVGKASARKGKQPIRIKTSPMLGTNVSVAKRPRTANAPIE